MKFAWIDVRHRVEQTEAVVDLVLVDHSIASPKANGPLVTIVHDLEDAAVTLGVLERGSEGVLLAAKQVGEASELIRICHGPDDHAPIKEFLHEQ